MVLRRRSLKQSKQIRILPSIFRLARAFMSSGQIAEAKTALGKAKNLLEGTTDREKSHFLCCELILSGEAKKARMAVQNHVSEWPRDAMIAQMSTSVFGLIGFSGESRS